MKHSLGTKSPSLHSQISASSPGRRSFPNSPKKFMLQGLIQDSTQVDNKLIKLNDKINDSKLPMNGGGSLIPLNKEIKLRFNDGSMVPMNQ